MIKSGFGDTPKGKVLERSDKKVVSKDMDLKKFELRCSKYINPLF